ncbi:MAG: aspartate carbamoyltransferase [Methylococcaceae bacterium]
MAIFAQRPEKVSLFATAMLGLMLTQPTVAQTANPERLEEVNQRGMHVMPFDLKQTQHIFTKTEMGGVQQVIARSPSNTRQIELIRQHLTKISQEFSRRDFSDPEKIHGKDMPGLAALRTAKPGQLHVQYKDLPNGAEITYTVDDKTLIDAVHQWFDAQLADHGPNAMPGMDHGYMHTMHDMQKMHDMHKQ